MKINRLLIANRGEIAVRIIRSARRMGIQTIAVYSSADKQALHVRAADEHFLLGGPLPSESYLNIDRIIDAAIATGADAVHSGYGFLAENPVFASRCAENDLIFIGPPVSAIETMGLKGVAREKMAAAGVPVLPGLNHTDSDEIEQQVEKIGYPVLIKPEAGGGGKGMKIVRSADELLKALESSRREALSSFGDDRLIVEKFLESPRHIEFQIFADAHGNCIHLNERDCSVQRRHQKVIEESPAPGISEGLRDTMGEAAVAAAMAIDYVGAGTVEFLLGEDDGFYFMEMNTRLQVEHPVTEMVTGFDLVEWQLRVAAGEPLPLDRSDVRVNGHAMEARIYAEDPLRDFLPASGRITRLDLPETSSSLRVDNGVTDNDLVGVYYDPMLMKIIAHGPDRPAALDGLRRGIEQLRLAGITTNRDFLLAVLANEAFRAGSVSTNWLDEDLGQIFRPLNDFEMHEAMCGAILFLLHEQADQTGSPWSTAHNFRLNQQNASRLMLMANDREYWNTVRAEAGLFSIEAVGELSRCEFVSMHPFRCTLNGETREFDVVRQGTRLTVFSSQRVIELRLPENVLGTHGEDEGNVLAPMSGKIVSVMVKEGDEVKKGTPLVTIEAMKMEHTVYAPADGIVANVFFVEQDLVNEGTELLQFEALDTLSNFP